MPAILPHFMRRSILFHLNIARQKLLVFCAFLIILTFVGNTLAALTPYQDFLSQNVNALNSRSLTVDSIEVDQETLGLAYKNGLLKFQWPIKWSHKLSCVGGVGSPNFLMTLIDDLKAYGIEINSFEFKNGSMQVEFSEDHLIFFLPVDSCIFLKEVVSSNKKLLGSIGTLRNLGMHVKSFNFNHNNESFNFEKGLMK